MAILLLIRHCEPVLKGVLLGQVDSPLSLAGHEHAAKTLSEIEVEVVWSSPLRRAVETAGYVRAAQRKILPDLREIDHGDWSGKTWAEVESGWSDLARRKSQDWNGVTAPGGESWVDFADRVNRAWDVIRAGPHPAAVVAHQGVNSALAAIILKQDPLQFEQRYGEVLCVEYS